MCTAREALHPALPSADFSRLDGIAAFSPGCIVSALALTPQCILFFFFFLVNLFKIYKVVEKLGAYELVRKERRARAQVSRRQPFQQFST